MIRICRKCKKEKSISLFKKDKHCRLGITHTCLSCIWEREKNKPMYYETRARYHEKNRAALREKRLKSPENHRRNILELQKKTPEKVSARSKIYRAIKTGRMVRGNCRDCGSDDVEAHHPDYSKPLEVIWLCPPHHAQEGARSKLL